MESCREKRLRDMKPKERIEAENFPLEEPKMSSQELWNAPDYSLTCDEEFRELSSATALENFYDMETEREHWLQRMLVSNGDMKDAKSNISVASTVDDIKDNTASVAKKLEKIARDTEASFPPVYKVDGFQNLLESTSTWDEEDRKVGKAYSEFLLSLYAPEGNKHDTNDDSSDEDFDYILEAENETDEEEEYRNDPTAKISGKELVDLVSGRVSYSFRNKKSGVKKRSFEKRKGKNHLDTSNFQVSNISHESMNTASFKRPSLIAPALTMHVPNTTLHSSLFYSLPLLKNTALDQISVQLNRHIQLLFQVCLLVAQEPLKDEATLNLSKQMLIEWKKVSDMNVCYRQFFNEAVADFEPEGSISLNSFFAISSLQQVPVLMDLLETRNYIRRHEAEQIFDTLVPHFEIEFYPQLQRDSSLNDNFSPIDAHQVDVKQLKQNLCEQEQWSVAEDKLIATLIRKFGSDWLDNYQRLLPSKDYDDVRRRYRQLSSRHAPDNPVKRLVIERQKPLTSEEWRILEYGVYLYGENAWKLIEVNLLPHRDQVILQRMWKQRQKRRRQKIRENERHKQEARRLARKLKEQGSELPTNLNSNGTGSLTQSNAANGEDCFISENTSESVQCRSNWLVVDGDVKIHFSQQDDKKLLSEVKAFGATEETFTALAKKLGKTKTPDIVKKRYAQLLCWIQQSSASACFSGPRNNSL
eukprot:jgi/Galph1/2704/GphlegSOOS_G1340.1